MTASNKSRQDADNASFGDYAGFVVRQVRLMNADEFVVALVNSFRSATKDNTRPNVNSTSAEVLAANPDRLQALIVNNSTAPVFLMLGEGAVVDQGIPLSPRGGFFKIDLTNLWVGSISAVKSGAVTVQLDVFEGEL